MTLINMEIDMGWCLWDTWRCTPTEALALWLACFFQLFVVFVTAVHFGVQSENGSDAVNMDATRRLTQTDDATDAFCPVPVLPLLTYISASAIGLALWFTKGLQWVHPLQNSLVQSIGVAMLVACYIGFIIVHVAMGKNWSPQPEVKIRHQLVLRGPFRWARHPMYAVFLWYGVATTVATLNWVIGLWAFVFFLLVYYRIPIEEKILLGLYGDDYQAYQHQVSALGPPWWCCSFRRRTSIPNYQLLVA